MEDVKSTEMNKFIKKYAEFKMQIHEKLQIGTIKCLMLKQILILKGNFWDIDPLNSPILWKFKIRLTEDSQESRPQKWNK